MPTATLLSRIRNRPLEFRQPKARGLLPPLHPRQAGNWFLTGLTPKASALGTPGTERGWAGPGEVRKSLLSLWDLGTDPLLCRRHSRDHFLRGCRQIPIRRKGPGTPHPWATPEKRVHSQPRSAHHRSMSLTCELCSGISF